MPIYEYNCRHCGKLEIQQSIKDAVLTECPECGSQQIKKEVTAPAFILKGRGFYKNDYKKDE